MSEWYFADRNRQQQGPVSADELGAHFRYGRVGLETLVWRDGMPQWQRLGDFAEELGLLAVPSASASAMPPPPPPPLGQAAAEAVASVHAAPRKGMSGGKIALIVAAALALPCLGLAGILAAIAIPAYNDYTLRAKTADAMTHGAALKPIVAERYLGEGKCPRNGEGGLGEPESYAGTHVTQAVIGEFDDGTCGFELEVGNTGNGRLDGKKIWFELDRDTADWICTSEIDDRLLPASCRG
ncbi:GYF domain-containing protein [Pseudoxanthomonas putridarboris]|uniref:GYF domain-containing protein n=1 Tax=Pseudoxanthomonas putridarboris TaxID=752605 RepID=A0ABU9IWR8_9GAMM